MSNSLDPDQAQCFVGPDLGPTVCIIYYQTTIVIFHNFLSSFGDSCFRKKNQEYHQSVKQLVSKSGLTSCQA